VFYNYYAMLTIIIAAALKYYSVETNDLVCFTRIRFVH